MKNLSLLILSLCFISVQAQQSFIEKYNLPSYDSNWTSYNKFWTSEVVIVTPNNADEVSNDAKNMLEYGKGKNIKVAIKSESQLEKDDFNRNIVILGSIQSYSHWDKLGIPVSKLKQGFKIGDHTFTDPLHSFTYVCDSLSTPMRIAYIGNSPESYRHLFDAPALGFNYHVKENAVPIYVGNNPTMFDLSDFKKKHYKTKESKYFIFMLSEDLSEEQNATCEERMEKYDRHAEAFVEKMKLDMPKEKIKTYIQADQQEIKYMCGAYWALKNEKAIMYGYAPGEDIHSWGFSDHTIEHEAGHYLINNQINKRTVTFISEGIQMWYMFTSNDAVKQQAMLMAKEFVSEDLTGLISAKTEFSGEKHYLISGIFVGYLIEKYGIDKFKELYKFDFHEAPIGFEKTYNEPLAVVLEEYKNWLLK